MDKFIVNSTHPEDLADGSIHSPGDEVNLSVKEQEDLHNAAMISDGRLMFVREETKKEREAREKAEEKARAEADLAAAQGDNENGGNS